MFRKILTGVVLALALIWLLVAPQSPTQAAGAEAQSHDGYRIVYMTSRGESGDLLAPSSIAELFASENVVISGDLPELDFIDAIIVDVDTLDGLTAGFFKEAYQAGKVIAFLNAYAPDVQYLTGDACIGREGWMDGSDPYPSTFYLIVAMKVTGNSDDVSTILAQATGENCSGMTAVEGVTGQAGIYTSRSQNSISGGEELRIFREVLLLEIKNNQ